MRQFENEKYLLQSLRIGDERAYRTLLERYAPLIFSLIDRMIYDRSHREDIAQEVFMKIVENINNFKGNSKLSTWIYTIAYRHILDVSKKKKKDLLTNSDEIDTYDDRRNQFGEMETEPYDQILVKKDMNKILQMLDERYRLPITLRYINGLPLKEIASVIGIPLSTTKTRIIRGLDRLKDIYVQQMKGALVD